MKCFCYFTSDRSNHGQLQVDNKKEARQKRGRLEAITESRGDNQGDEKKGKTYMRRSSTGKKEGGKACVLWLVPT